MYTEISPFFKITLFLFWYLTLRDNLETAKTLKIKLHDISAYFYIGYSHFHYC